MGETETALAAYQAARQEVIERIRLRDNALVMFLGATSVVFGLAVDDKARSSLLLLLIPYLALAASFILAQHDRTIGALCAFITDDLRKFLRGLRADAPMWESSQFLREYTDLSILMRTLSNLILIILPAVLSLAWAWSTIRSEGKLIQSVWWGGCAVTVMMTILLVATHLDRKSKYDHTTWQKYGDQAGKEAQNDAGAR